MRTQSFVMLPVANSLVILAGLTVLSIEHAQADQVIPDNVVIQTSNTPKVEFSQTAGMFSAYQWDVAGNDANFFVRDVTGGGHLVMRLKPGAPENSLLVDSTGFVGIGTQTPTAQLHVYRTASPSTAEILNRWVISDDAIGRLDINNASSTDGVFVPRMQGKSGSLNAALIMEGLITTDSGTGPAIVYNAAKLSGGAVATRPLVVYRNNNVAKVTIGAAGDVYGTSFNPTSSRTLKDNIVKLDSQKATQGLQQLDPVEYVFKDDPTGKKRVGFIAEDVPDIVANADRKSIPMMDVLALLTRVVKDQQQTIEEQRRINTAIMQRLALLEEQSNR